MNTIKGDNWDGKTADFLYKTVLNVGAHFSNVVGANDSVNPTVLTKLANYTSADHIDSMYMEKVFQLCVYANQSAKEDGILDDELQKDFEANKDLICKVLHSVMGLNKNLKVVGFWREDS
ncbi:MAG: hypothetical protein KME47_09575 [Nodosilinea sp. WJT8-NPBG4]|jgi:hypothetical protein|nr:hypothetical protein [Nodosilinea sp. WJT8-NPBG4]